MISNSRLMGFIVIIINKNYILNIFHKEISHRLNWNALQIKSEYIKNLKI